MPRSCNMHVDDGLQKQIFAMLKRRGVNTYPLNGPDPYPSLNFVVLFSCLDSRMFNEDQLIRVGGGKPDADSRLQPPEWVTRADTWIAINKRALEALGERGLQELEEALLSQLNKKRQNRSRNDFLDRILC